MSADTFFRKSLQDLIKGIRSTKRDIASFISQTILEIKNELKSTDPFTKSEAVRKLTYLQMIGYNVSWASFSIIEVMSQSRFAHKRIGYLAANQIFDENTDVILLTTNLFKKELYSQNHYEAGLAINCLANIINKDLAKDCLPDLVAHLSHPKPYIRKKTVLAMYKLYLQYPSAIRHTVDKLKDCLDDADISVVSTAVNVICELANKNPKSYLPMAPQFFRLLTTASNNWMLIKVVKLMTALVTEEPRLARKLLEPLATIIQNTGAKSLKYECIHAITEALPYSKREDGTEPKNYGMVIKLCSDYLRGFIEDNDQNLKYLGLVGLLNLLRSSPKSVVEHRDLILRCLDDDDITIRIKALDLIVGIASKKSLIELVKHLLEKARRAESTYRDEIITRILFVCKNNKYEMITDFAWYVSILLDLAVLQGSLHGKEVAQQLMEICLRVDYVRAFAVDQMLSLILNDNLFFGQARATLSEVLKAAAWIVGEYSPIVTTISKDVDDMCEEPRLPFWIEAPLGEEVRSTWRGQPLHEMLLNALLSPKTTNLSENVQIVYIHAATKIFIRVCLDFDLQSITNCVNSVRKGLPIFLQNINVEVQERSTVFLQLLTELGILQLEQREEAEEESKKADNNHSGDLIEINTKINSFHYLVEAGAQAAIRSKLLLQTMVTEPFYAVHLKAQRKVPIPTEIDIEMPFNPKSFSKLLDYEIDSTVSLQSVRFVQDSSVYKYSALGNLNADEDKASELLKDGFIEEIRASGAPASSFVSKGSGNNDIPTPDDVFNLSRKTKNQDLVPLSKALAEGLQELTLDHGTKKRRKKATIEIDKREMLPAGALSSDEETSKAKQKLSFDESAEYHGQYVETERFLEKCRPYKLTEEDMQKKLLSSSGVRLDRTLLLRCYLKYGKAVKIVQKLFHAHLVGGSEASGAAFLASKIASSIKLLLMMQYQKDEITIDVRCIGNDASSVQSFLVTVVNSLEKCFIS